MSLGTILTKFYNKLKAVNNSFLLKKRYRTMDRGPFYDIAIPYLPEDADANIVDIGAGDGGFASHLNLYDKYRNVLLLDASKQAVQDINERGLNAILYSAPEKLPFEPGTVDVIHCSHLVEHLTHTELYSFLKELNRVLRNGGTLIISAPLLWTGFYGDLSHIKPYHPGVFVRYLCKQSGQNTAETISQEFAVQKLIYRYIDSELDEWGATNIVFDLVCLLTKRVLGVLGIKKYIRNGFTLVLQKRSDVEVTKHN